MMIPAMIVARDRATVLTRGAVLALALSFTAFTAACGGPPAEPPAPSPAPADAPAPPDAEAGRSVAVTGADPRVGLDPGWRDAETASRHMELVANRPRPEGFYDEDDLGNILLANSDMAYRGDLLFMGSFNGFQIWDISDPANPTLRTAVICPGGQGDLSIHGDLLFMSVEMPNARVDCEEGSMRPGADPDRFLGVRIFDVSDLDNPRQVGGVQTCRGSHTHTLLPDSADDSHVYVYVSGTSGVRPDAELEGCTGLEPEMDTTTALFRIEVIRVPLDAPQDARIVNEPRIFAVDEDIAGLWPGGPERRGAQTTARTDQCHDITSFPALGIAAGACAGNGLILDISDPENPVRAEAVFDPNFAYWHSATFNNDGTRVLYTDEWGGGLAPRCQRDDPRLWGANAIFDLDLQDMELTQRGYYKLPAPQQETENCVAHNGSIVPVPGRDIMVQAWYQGGVSVFDFTDPEDPVEIAFFDRGPMADELLLGGVWSAYWYNGYIYGSEIGRGLDVYRLTPSEHLTQNEIDAANLVRFEVFNPQTQPRITWPASFVVARAYLDQLRRGGRIAADRLDRIATGLDQAEGQGGAARRSTLDGVVSTVDELRSGAAAADARRLDALRQTLRDLRAGS